MNRHVLFLPLVWLTSMCLLGLTGCGKPNANTAGEKILIFGRGSDSVTLDPADAEDGESVKVIINIYSRLLEHRPDSTELRPGLAKEMPTASNNGKTWTFKLRDNVKFHDGTPVNAEAVKYSFQRMIDPKIRADQKISAPYSSVFTVIDKIETPDELTVVFQLNEPSAVFVNTVSMFCASIVSPTAVKKYGPDFGSHPVGCGAFRFDEWRPKEQISLTANADFYEGKPKVDYLIFKPVDAPSVPRMLKKGEIHLADNLDVPIQKQIEEDKSLTLITGPGMNVGYFALNTSKAPFDKVEVRQAVAHAINKKEIIDNALKGRAEVATSVVPKVLWGHADNLKDYEYNPTKAKQMLKDAGVKEGTKIELWVMPVPRPYFPDPKAVAAILKNQLQQVGFEPVVQSPPWSQYLDQVGQGAHQTCMLGWSADMADPDNFLYVLLDKDNAKPPKALNVSFYQSEEFHDLIMKAKVEVDKDKRKQLYINAQEVALRDCPLIPLTHSNKAVGLNGKVTGFQLYPTGDIYLHQVGLK